MTNAEQVANAFHIALKTENWSALRYVLTDDASWILPGDNAVSGLAENADEVVARARLIASYGMKFDLKYTLLSQSNMTLFQHNKAKRGGRSFDQHVATVCRLRDAQISQIETFVSDLDGFSRFFIKDDNQDAGQGLT